MQYLHPNPSMKKAFGFLLLAISSITVVHAQAILSGVIKNEKSNEVLEGATIFLIEYTRGTYADESGKFSFSNFKDANIVRIMKARGKMSHSELIIEVLCYSSVKFFFFI
jgi:hypothetical protein